MKYLLYRLKWHLAKYIIWSYPLHVDIELTSRCNLRCHFCPHSLPGFVSGDMSDDTFANIMLQISGKVPSIKFNLRGESTLHPNFIDAIRYAWMLNTFVDRRLNTNGQYKDVRISTAMVNYLTDISFSVDAFFPFTYKKVRGGSLSQVEKNIKDVVSLINNKSGKKPILRLSFTITDENKDEVEKFKGYWKAIYPKIKFTIRHAMDRVNGTHTLGEHVAVGRKDCLMPRRRLSITHDGKISFCCLLWHNPFFIDNVLNEKSIEHAWNGGLISSIRYTLRRNEFIATMCKNCDSSEAYIWEEQK